MKTLTVIILPTTIFVFVNGNVITIGTLSTILTSSDNDNEQVTDATTTTKSTTTTLRRKLDHYRVTSSSSSKNRPRRRFRPFWDYFQNLFAPIRPQQPDIVDLSPPPSPSPSSEQQPKHCVRTNDCDAQQYCASRICTASGSCSSVEDCYNPNNEYRITEDCRYGPIVCSETGLCDKQCTSSGNCLDETDGYERNCVQEPCNLAETGCTLPGFVACVNDYCNGGCNALVFDPAGNYELCLNVVEPITSVDEPTLCDGCQDDEYCSFGECREKSTCDSLSDCRNPANNFDTIDCIGPISCDNGLCNKTCEATECPNGEEPYNCFVSPCQILAGDCDVPVESCIDDYCGGCTSYAFDDAGTRICHPSNAEPPLSCYYNRDCPTGLYCGHGLCLEMGTCTTNLDCQNPTNVYDKIECAGYLFCNTAQGVCEIDCSQEECGSLQPPVNCYEFPCDVVECNEMYERCIDNNCNGCTAIFLDSFGSQVCANV